MDEKLRVFSGKKVKAVTPPEMGKTGTRMDHIGLLKDWFETPNQQDVSIPATLHIQSEQVSGEARITWKKNDSPTSMLNGAGDPKSIAHAIVEHAEDGFGLSGSIQDDQAVFLLIPTKYMQNMKKGHLLTNEDVELIASGGDPTRLSNGKQARIDYSDSDNALALILHRANKAGRITFNTNGARLVAESRTSHRPHNSWINRVRNFSESEKYLERKAAASDQDSVAEGFTGGMVDKYLELSKRLNDLPEDLYALAAQDFVRLNDEQRAFFAKAGFDERHFPKRGMSFMNYEQRLICALAAKPFVILAGGTGTGKTKSAIETVKKLCKPAADGKASDQFEVVAVGADWTDTRPLLGYVNLLIENGPAYSAPAALKLILRAHKNPGLPYFLILDEMNLSHVERYFSDFLSLMEARKIDKSAATIKLHSQTGDMKAAEDGAEDVPAEIPWPTNLFVIGTVNIDETTHMFSPKVLDRAHVIEYKVDWEAKQHGQHDILSGLGKMVAKGSVSDDSINYSEVLGPTLVESPAERLKGIDTGPMKECTDRIGKIWNSLSSTRFAFSHRTAQEAVGYVLIASALAASEAGSKVIGKPSTDALIDLAVLQKILPKINGSTETLSSPRAESGKQDTNLLEQLKAACKGLPGCEEKLTKMIETLQREHFVSFIQ